jgi:hypothetical protein
MSDEENRTSPTLSTRVTREQLAQFDALAESIGVSRCNLVHDIIEGVLDLAEPKRKWEYCTVASPFRESLAQQLVRLGLEAWELVSVCKDGIGFTAWLKRPTHRKWIEQCKQGKP